MSEIITNNLVKFVKGSYENYSYNASTDQGKLFLLTDFTGQGRLFLNGVEYTHPTFKLTSAWKTSQDYDPYYDSTIRTNNIKLIKAAYETSRVLGREKVDIYLENFKGSITTTGRTNPTYNFKVNIVPQSNESQIKSVGGYRNLRLVWFDGTAITKYSDTVGCTYTISFKDSADYEEYFEKDSYFDNDLSNGYIYDGEWYPDEHSLPKLFSIPTTTGMISYVDSHISAATPIATTSTLGKAKFPASGGLAITNEGAVSVNAGNGLQISNNAVTVKAKTNGGITVDSNGVSITTPGPGLTIPTTGTNAGKIKVDLGLNENSGWGLYTHENNSLRVLCGPGITLTSDQTYSGTYPKGVAIKKGKGLTFETYDPTETANPAVMINLATAGQTYDTSKTTVGGLKFVEPSSTSSSLYGAIEIDPTIVATQSDLEALETSLTHDTNKFKTIAISTTGASSITGTSNVVADSDTDTLTLVAGDNITLNTDATNDKIKISSSDEKVAVDTASGSSAITVLLSPSTSPGHARAHSDLNYTPSTSTLSSTNFSGTKFNGTTFNGLTLTSAATGFTIAGGTTSKTLTVNKTLTLDDAAAKGVDTSINSGSASTNLPTTAAVATFVQNEIEKLGVALSFVGVSSTDPSGASGATVTGHTTWKKGEVVLYGNKEYVVTDVSSATPPVVTWTELGDEGSYALKTIKIIAGGGLTGGAEDLTDDVTISHAGKASGLNNVTHTNNQFIDSITFDEYGHVTAVTTAQESINNHFEAKNIIGASDSAKADATTTNDTTFLNLVENNTVRSHHKIKGSGSVSVAHDTTNGLVITGTDENVIADSATDNTTYKLFFGENTTAAHVKKSTNLTYNPSTKVLTNDNASVAAFSTASSKIIPTEGAVLATINAATSAAALTWGTI